MASKNQAKVEFIADTKGFQSGIKQANSALTQLRSELKLNKTEANSAGDSMENLANRQKILSQEIETQQSKIGNLTQVLETARNAFGDGSIEVQKYQTQLNNAQSVLVRMQQDLDATTSAMDEMRAANTQAESAMGKMESTVSKQEAALAKLKSQYNQVAAEQGDGSDAARYYANQIEKVSSELRDNKSKLEQAESAADKFDRTLGDVGDTARDTSNDLDAMDVAIGDFVSDVAQNAISSLAGLEESTRQYRNEQNKLVAVSQQTGQSLGDLQTGYSNLYAITGDETLASTAVLNMSAMGISAQDQSVLVNAAAGAWAAYGDSIPLDGLLESINETTRAGTVTGSFADALNWAQMSSEQWSAALGGNSKAQQAFNKGIADGMTVEDAFNEALAACSDTGERQKLVTEAMNAAYGELGSTYQTANADVIAANEASMNLTNAQAALGEAVAPVTTGFQNLVAFGLQWFVDNLPVLTPLLAGLAVGLGGLLVVTVIAPAMASLAGTLATLSAPVMIVIGVIALLAAGFLALWNSSETFRNGVMQVWTTIQTVFGILADWLYTNVITPIVTYFSSLTPQLQAIWTGIQNLINVAMGLISGFISSNMGTIQGIWSTVWGLISGVASTVWGAIQTIISTALNVIQGIITTVTAIMSGDWEGALNGIMSIAETIFNGISSFISGIMNGISGTIGNVLSGISSTVSSILSGISGFFSDNFGAIGDTVSSVIDTAKNVVSGGLDAISGFFRGVHLELPKIKLPHFSISGSFSLNPPSIPHIGVSWYAKGGILEEPTIFGFNGGNAMVGGEAGPEAVAPIGDLLGYMIEALDAKFGQSDTGALVDAIESLADRVISIEINGKQLARATASDNDRASGSRQKLINRGVSLA